jgi:FMN phosphatase YigB (HAD superfamily)
MQLSFQEGIRKPSRAFYERAVQKFAEHGIAPDAVLYVGCRLRDDLAVAKSIGMRTALYAADKISMRATKEDMKNPELRPDRLLTDLAQVREILNIG